jgi:nuclear transport factor 2 (NTF2) superfamily protein
MTILTLHTDRHQHVHFITYVWSQAMYFRFINEVCSSLKMAKICGQDMWVQWIINTVQLNEKWGFVSVGQFHRRHKTINLAVAFQNKCTLVGNELSSTHMPTTMAPYVDAILSMKHLL